MATTSLPILRTFTVFAVAAIGAVGAAAEIIHIAERKERSEMKTKGNNGVAEGGQDRLDTIFDRTKMMKKAKEEKPWNRTASEFERRKW